MNKGKEGKMSKASQGSEIFSIFGQIEAAAAEFMIGKGKATKINAREIPAAVAYNDAGTPARFAVTIKRADVREFKRVISDLRA